MAADDVEAWDSDFGFCGIGERKDQLLMHFKQFTNGNAAVIVRTCGVGRACEAWRQLADAGFSPRSQNLSKLHKKAMYPKKDVPNKDVENAIMEWQRDIEISVKTRNEAFSAFTQRMLLIDMCSPALRYQLDMREYILRN